MLEKYNVNQTTLKILQLYSGEYGKRLHLREIARAVGVDVKAVQLQLRNLEENNVLRSELRGRNKDFSLNPENPMTMYHMVLAEVYTSIRLMETSYPIKRVAGELLGKVRGIVAVFGSYAKAVEDEESDIDILVIGDDLPVELTDLNDVIGREVNIRHISTESFSTGIKNRDPLIVEVESSHVLLSGFDDFCEAMWNIHKGS